MLFGKRNPTSEDIKWRREIIHRNEQLTLCDSRKMTYIARVQLLRFWLPHITPVALKARLVTQMNRLILSFSIVLVLSLGVCAQSETPKLNHFAADGVSFDYPDAYTVKDESNTEAQRLTLTRRGSSVQLTIVAKKGWVLSNEVPAAIEKTTEPLVKQVSETLGGGTNLTERAMIKTMVGSKEAEGVRLRSSATSKRTGEVIWLRLSLRLISLALVRSDHDESAAAQLWQAVRSSIKAEPPVIAALKTVPESAPEPTHEPITGGVLNGKALALPQPTYPPIARAAHVSGTVIVQVVIDEQGNVVAAKAVEGHPLLQAACVTAAREAKFSPTTLEGEPVRVTGVIQYHFVAR